MYHNYTKNKISLLINLMFFVLCLSVIPHTYAGKKKHTSSDVSYQQVSTKPTSWWTAPKILAAITGGIIFTGTVSGITIGIYKYLHPTSNKPVVKTCPNAFQYFDKTCVQFRQDIYTVLKPECLNNNRTAIRNTELLHEHNNISSDVNSTCLLAMNKLKFYVKNNFENNCTIEDIDSVLCLLNQSKQYAEDTGIAFETNKINSNTTSGRSKRAKPFPGGGYIQDYPGEFIKQSQGHQNYWGERANFLYKQLKGPNAFDLKDAGIISIDPLYLEKLESLRLHFSELAFLIFDHPDYGNSNKTFNDCFKVSGKQPYFVAQENTSHRTRQPKTHLEKHARVFTDCFFAHVNYKTSAYNYRMATECTEIKKLIEATSQDIINAFLGDLGHSTQGTARNLAVTEIIMAINSAAYDQKLNSACLALHLDAGLLNSYQHQGESYSNTNATNANASILIYNLRNSNSDNDDFIKDMSPETFTSYVSGYIESVNQLVEHPEKLDLYQSVKNYGFLTDQARKYFFNDVYREQNVSTEDFVKISSEQFQKDLKLQANRILKSFVVAAVEDYKATHTNNQVPYNILKMPDTFATLPERITRGTFYFSDDNPSLHSKDSIPSSRQKRAAPNPLYQTEDTKPQGLVSSDSPRYGKTALFVTSALASYVAYQQLQQGLHYNKKSQPCTESKLPSEPNKQAEDFTGWESDYASESIDHSRSDNDVPDTNSDSVYASDSINSASYENVRPAKLYKSNHSSESTNADNVEHAPPTFSCSIEPYQVTNLLIANEWITDIQLRTLEDDESLPVIEAEQPFHSCKMTIRNILITLNCHANELLPLLDRYSTMFVTNISTANRKTVGYVEKLDNMPFAEIKECIDHMFINLIPPDSDGINHPVRVSELLNQLIVKYPHEPLSKVLGQESDCDILKALEDFLDKKCWTPKEFNLSRLFADRISPLIFCKTQKFEITTLNTSSQNKTPCVLLMPSSIHSKALIDQYIKQYMLPNALVIPYELLPEYNVHLPIEIISSLLHEVFPEEMKQIGTKFLAYDVDMLEHNLKTYLQTCDPSLKNIIWDLMKDETILEPSYGEGLLYDYSALTYAEKEWENVDGLKISCRLIPTLQDDIPKTMLHSKQETGLFRSFINKIFPWYTQEQVAKDPYCHRPKLTVNELWTRGSFPEYKIQKNIRKLLQMQECKDDIANLIIQMQIKETKNIITH